MSKERRIHHRVSQPLEGRWWGSSGATRCRISDISVSGCFVQSLMNPTAGEQTKVTVFIGQGELTLDGRIVYAESGMGFAVQFAPMSDDDAVALAELIEALEPGASRTPQ